VIFGQLVVVEIVERGLVPVADVDDGGGGRGQIGRGGFAAHERHGVQGKERTAREKLVFVGTSGMRED
jgi:hypothetical protein